MPDTHGLDIAFEAPGRTLFLLDPRWLHILPFEGGHEARVSTTDFLEFLLHLTLHQAAALVILQVPPGLLERVLYSLSAALTRVDHA